MDITTIIFLSKQIQYEPSIGYNACGWFVIVVDDRIIFSDCPVISILSLKMWKQKVNKTRNNPNMVFVIVSVAEVEPDTNSVSHGALHGLIIE